MDLLSNISEQILPVNQLKVFVPTRDRSRSETELNLCINPVEDVNKLKLS